MMAMAFILSVKLRAVLKVMNEQCLIVTADNSRLFVLKYLGRNITNTYLVSWIDTKISREQ